MFRKLTDNRKKNSKLNTTRIIVIGFAALILTGAFLLMLPISSKDGTPTPFINSLFTSATSVCVTGLVVYDTYTHWSLFGQLVILCLIQIGGLGFISISTILPLLMNRSIGLKKRLLLSESFGLGDISGIVRITRLVILGTLMFEFLGGIVLSFQFVPDFGFANGIYKGFFHSVSAFCNAGIDLMGQNGEFSSLTAYCGNPVVNITIMALILLGGTGFFVWDDIYHAKRFKDLTMHSRIVLSFNLALVLIGAAVIFSADFSKALKGMNFGEKILASLFQSVTCRTAGFNTVNLSALSTSSFLIMLLLMFIGGAPGSTAGGVKITTMGVLFFTALATVRGKENVSAFSKTIDKVSSRRAVTIVLISIAIVFISMMLLSLFEPYLTLKEVMFEIFSAFGTVGVTLGITPYLGIAAKILLIFLMFFGRVGIFTIMLSITIKNANAKANIVYPAGKILI